MSGTKKKPKYNLNEVGNKIKFTRMSDKDRIKLIKTHVIIDGNYQFIYDGRKKKIIKREILCN
jgi:hypothetical protein